MIQLRLSVDFAHQILHLLYFINKTGTEHG